MTSIRVGASRTTRVLAAGLASAAVAAVGTSAALGAGRPTLSGSTLSAGLHVAGLPAVTWGRSIRLSAHETFSGRRSFVLEAQQFPFTSGFQTIASGKTTRAFSVAVKPSRATRYRLVLGGNASRVLTVYVLPRLLSTGCNLCHQGNTPGDHQLIMTGKLQAPPGAPVAAGPVYFYYAQANGSHAAPSTLHLVKTVPLHVHGQILSFSVTYMVHFPTGPFQFQPASCFKDAEPSNGLGLPGHHHCGDASVTRGEYLG